MGSTIHTFFFWSIIYSADSSGFTLADPAKKIFAYVRACHRGATSASRLLASRKTRPSKTRARKAVSDDQGLPTKPLYNTGTF